MFTNDEIVLLGELINSEQKSLLRALKKLSDHEVVTKTVYEHRIENLSNCFQKLTQNFIENNKDTTKKAKPSN